MKGQQQQQQQPQPKQEQNKQQKQGQQQRQQQQECKTEKKRSAPWLFTALLGLIPGLSLLTATFATIIRFFAGFGVCKPLGPRPSKHLKLYEYEGDPNSRLVREALSMLDLDCIILPCPKGSKRFRREAMQIGGKEKFPLLVDDNTERRLYSARNIVPYLFKNYGTGRVPFLLRMPFAGLFSFFASLVRGFSGVRRTKGIRDVKLEPTSIELYSYEASPHCRLVREVLTELEIPYLLHNVAKRSPKRKQFVERSGKMMVPFLIDSNTDKGTKGMFESRDIVKYLCKTYGSY
jgi:glutathione S-transferase